MATADGSSAQRIPAWKKLGLKLKQPAASAGASASDAEAAVGGSVGHPSSSDGLSKRKTEHQAPEPPAKKRKSVSFGDTPTQKSIGVSTAKSTPSKPALARATSKPTPAKQSTPAKPGKQSKSKAAGPAKKKKEAEVTDFKPALEYLRQYGAERGNWKFSKNHQTTLLKHAFDATVIPAKSISTFYEYIRDLKGLSRDRLREEAMEVRRKDEADGAEGFPKGMKDIRTTHQKYESVLTELLQRRDPTTKKRAFDEQEFVDESDENQLLIERIIKRMRAEMVLDEFSDDTTTTASTVSTERSEDSQADEAEAPKRARLNDGRKKARKRKKRVDEEDETSSSESESASDSDSDTSSSGSSDEEEDAAEETSSSSSSSSDESESESDSDES